MTVVLPSVSTAGNLRMIARRRAIRPTPMASVIVTAAGNPSGIAPTANATAATNISTIFSPRHTPTAKANAANPKINHSKIRLNCATRRVSGVDKSTASEIRRAIRPVSVWSPVAQTTPSASPRVTNVPANARFLRSASTVCRARGLTCLRAGSDSPVNIDSSISRLRRRTRRRSAGTRSPD
jgi:hypothetical protein